MLAMSSEPFLDDNHLNPPYWVRVVQAQTPAGRKQPRWQSVLTKRGLATEGCLLSLRFAKIFAEPDHDLVCQAWNCVKQLSERPRVHD